MATALFIWLKELLASINKIPSVPSSSKTWLIACMAASALALWPAAHVFVGDPAAAYLISSFKKTDLVLPIIRLSTSPTFIGQIPGLLSSGISLQEV